MPEYRADVARCPECHASCKSWVTDLALEQRTLERDRQQAMNAIQARRQALGEARIEAVAAQDHQKRAQAQYEAAQRWHYPNSVDVQESRQRLLEANGRLASARVALQQAEAAAGVWGTS